MNINNNSIEFSFTLEEYAQVTKLVIKNPEVKDLRQPKEEDLLSQTQELLLVTL